MGLLVLMFQNLQAQSAVNAFLKPSDSLNVPRRNTVVISEVALSAGVLVGLNQLWYADYARSDFHFINDNSEWLQMDKAGHVFSSYHFGKLGKEALQWSGASRKSQLIYGSTLGFVFLTAVEVMDGYSSNWGASWGDVAANATGTALFVSQELLWKEQRIIPKFSSHTTPYASARPNALGNSLNEQLLKDYNGQTYWLSANVHSFFKDSKIPKWLNVAVGYGAEGMITGEDAFVNTIFLPERKRIRQFYFSFDADLTKIKTKSHVLKTVFSIFNTIKIPAPTFEYRADGKGKLRALYF
ncbi:Predicted lipoprotein [Flavobacterium noncentrifugens]|uniref:Predicted lipoprotein n=2 Tax=Flavobacterium noncentrifugens TaxID=1128970 RepID=A0A1G9CQS1_9FLAO|nr:Predicted lipoprotein [Flavobacterium noncentrifugens]